jgi:DNA-binding XRE family transcriptional regulator
MLVGHSISKYLEDAKDKGVSNSAVADAIGIRPNSLINITKNRNSPSIQIVIKLADYFNISIDDLIGRKIKSKPYTVEVNSIDVASEPPALYARNQLKELTILIQQMQRDIEELKQSSDNQISNQKKVSQK